MFGYGATWLSTGASVITRIGAPVAGPFDGVDAVDPPVDAAVVAAPAVVAGAAVVAAAAVVAERELLLLSPPQAATARPLTASTASASVLLYRRRRPTGATPPTVVNVPPCWFPLVRQRPRAGLRRLPATHPLQPSRSVPP